MMFTRGFEKVAVSTDKVLATVKSHRSNIFKNTGIPQKAVKFDAAANKLIKSVSDLENLPSNIKSEAKRAYLKNYIQMYRRKHGLLSTKQVNDLKEAAFRKNLKSKMLRAGVISGIAGLSAAGYGLKKALDKKRNQNKAAPNVIASDFVTRAPAYGLLSTSENFH